MRAQFVRGGEPMDAMELGDVTGRKMKAAHAQLKKVIEDLAVQWWGSDEILKHETNPYMRIKEKISKDQFIEMGIEVTEGDVTNYFYLVYTPNTDMEEGEFLTHWAAGYTKNIKPKWPTSPAVKEKEQDEIPYDTLEDAINKMIWWYQNI